MNKIDILRLALGFLIYVVLLAFIDWTWGAAKPFSQQQLLKYLISGVVFILLYSFLTNLITKAK